MLFAEANKYQTKGTSQTTEAPVCDHIKAE